MIQLVKSGEVETTLPRAKALKSCADRLITIGKQVVCSMSDFTCRHSTTPQPSARAHHQLKRVLRSEELTKKVQMYVDLSFRDRAGGYSCVRSTRTRKGDSVRMAKVQYILQDDFKHR